MRKIPTVQLKKHKSERIYPSHVASNPIYKTAWYACRYDDRNAVILVDGAPGSCKTGWALRYAQDMDLKWDYKKKKWVCRFELWHIVFKVKDLIEIAMRKDLPKGTVVIYDEAGVESDNTTYFDMHSKILRWVLQTWRYKNAILIITTPSTESLTVGIRRVATMRVETYGRRRGEKNKASCRILFLQPGHKKGKTMVYEKYPRFSQVVDGIKVWKRITNYVFPRPCPTLETVYKIRKEQQTQDWYGLFNEEIKYMKGFLKDKGGYNEGETADVLKVYETYKELMPSFIGAKGSFSAASVEKKLTEDGINLSGKGRTRLRQLLHADFDKTFRPTPRSDINKLDKVKKMLGTTYKSELNK